MVCVQVEYNVRGTCSTNKVGDECNATKMVRLLSPSSGYIIYGMAHLHVGGLGSVLYGQVFFSLLNNWSLHFL